jgi:hypothetical protein
MTDGEKTLAHEVKTKLPKADLLGREAGSQEFPHVDTGNLDEIDCRKMALGLRHNVPMWCGSSLEYGTYVV